MKQKDHNHSTQEEEYGCDTCWAAELLREKVIFNKLCDSLKDEPLDDRNDNLTPKEHIR